MDRRAVLGSAITLAAAAGGLGAATAPVAQQRGGRSRADSRPWIVTHDGHSLYYKEWGTGAPMVFLGAWALPSDMWDYQMVPLSTHNVRCIAYDRRGHGRSSRPGAGYDYDSLADDLAAVLDTL